MSSGGDSGAKSREAKQKMEAEIKAVDDFIKQIQSDTTISDATRDELLKKASQSKEVYDVMTGRGESRRLNKGEMALANDLRGAVADPDDPYAPESSLLKEFEDAKAGLGAKYKSRQMQKTMGELRKDQPGILQTRIVK